MDQRLTFITIGVKDLTGLATFYKDKFGWTPLKDGNDIVFFKLNGIILGLFPGEELAKEAAVVYTDALFKGFTLSINYNSEAEVDKAFQELSDKGVHIVKAPEKVFWGGYSGYVADPEHNLWEIAFNPFLEMDADGNVLAHP